MLIKYVPSNLSSKEGRDYVNSVVSSLVHMINFVNNFYYLPNQKSKNMNHGSPLFPTLHLYMYLYMVATAVNI